MKLRDKIDKYSTWELRKLGKVIISETRLVLGHGNKPVPKIRINNKLSGMYGQYDYDYTITINPSVCKTLSKFVGVIIHEYTHHIQKGLKQNYNSSVEKNGYYDSPFEVEARHNGKKYKRRVWKRVKKSLQNP